MIKRDVLKEFLVFCGVGGFNTLITLGLILFFSKILGFHYVTANMTGCVIGVICGFILHKNVTFRKRNIDRKLRHQILHFLLVFGVGYCVQLIVLIALVHELGIYESLAQIIACGVFAMMNYMGNRFWTFRDRGETAS